MGGVVACGKEANVYYASHGEHTPEGVPGDLAVKVFRTVNEFRNREAYLDAASAAAWVASKPKALRRWAQRELRNLVKMQRHGIRCPTAVGLYKHVLVMEFMGKDSLPAPTLKEAARSLSAKQLDEAYVELCLAARALYGKARLVHADLSEYNVLWHEGHAVVIDVAQAVPFDHPNATTFLRRDCLALTTFFVRCGLQKVLSTRELFGFVCDPTLPPGAEATTLAELRAASTFAHSTAEDDADTAVFMQAYIPPAKLARDARDPVDLEQGLLEGRPECLSYLAMVGLPVRGATQDDTQDDDGDDDGEEGTD